MKISIFIKNLFAGITALALVLSPAYVFAQGNNQGKGNARSGEIRAPREQIKEERKLEKEERKQDRLQIQKLDDDSDEDEDEDGDDNDNNRQNAKNKCVRAFGHLIAPGWIKNNGEIDWSDFAENCFLPFGISKKNSGDWNNGTTTKDTTAPVISSITVRKSDTQAVIRWNTDELADSTVFYSTTTNFDKNASTTKKVSDDDFESFHRVLLTGLTASTTYYVKVESEDKAGNKSTSEEFSFKTEDVPVVLDTTAPIISEIVGDVGTTSIKISWSTNEPATSKIYFGTTLPIDTGTSTTPSVESNTLVSDHILSIGGLSTSTLYYLLVESTDGSGNKAESSVFSTTTQSEL